MLYLNGTFKTCFWAVWKVDETEQQLLSHLTHMEWLDRVLQCKSQARRIEMLAVRVLLKTVLCKEVQIDYEEAGRPFLKDGSYYISISHTKGFVAICLDKNVQSTLDIEKCGEKVLRVRAKFTNSLEFIDELNLQKHLLLFWTAKEAMYKYLNNSTANFKEHFHIHPFCPYANMGYFKAYETLTKKRQNFDASYYACEQFILTLLRPSSKYNLPQT